MSGKGTGGIRRRRGRPQRARPPRSRSRGTRLPEEVLLGGRRVVDEALRAGLAAEVLVTPASRTASRLRDLVRRAAEAGVDVVEAPPALLDSVTPDHQGVAARVRMPPLRGEGDVQAFKFGSDAVVVILDGISDPQNVGAAARAAEAAGAEMLILRERRSARVTAAAVRASAGALLHLPHALVPNLTRTLESLKERGFSAVGLDERAEVSIYDRPCPPGRVALVVGSEGAGISRLVRRSCDFLVRLPMAGSVGSLNAASALAAVLYGYVLDRGKPRRA